MVKEGDVVLVRECQQGSRSAFEQLLNRYERPVFNVALRILNDSEDARDVTQAAFLKAFEHLASYDPKYRFFSWIYRIAVNESLNVLHSRRPSAPISEDRASERRGPDDELDRQQFNHGVQDALMAIKAEYRAVIVLRHFAECSYCDIGEILGLPEKTVKSRLYAARQVLAEVLRERGIS